MSPLEEVIYSAIATIIGALIIYLLSKWIELSIIKPKQRFNSSLIDLYSFVLFNENVLTNGWSEGDVNKEFNESVSIMQKDLRLQWSKIMSAYLLLNKITFILNPSKEKMKLLGKNLLLLSNSSIILPKNSKRVNIDDRIESVKKIKTFIESRMGVNYGEN